MAMMIRANFQPMPQTQVDRKPLEQRTWSWWTITVEMNTATLSVPNSLGNTVIATPSFGVDDLIVYGGKNYRIQSINDWDESGYAVYQAIEDFQVST